MELINTFPENLKSLNELCRHIIMQTSVGRQMSKAIENYPNLFEDRVIDTTLDADIFLKLYQISLNNPKMSFLLYRIVDILHENSCSNEVLQLLTSYPDVHFRERFVIALSHKKMPVEMLKKLCETNICFECFFELIILQYANDEFSKEDLKNSIAQFLNSPFKEMWPDLVFELKKIETNRDKITLVSHIYCNKID